MNIELLAENILRKRSIKGVREAAREIGVSSATLSRVENNKVPDLATFSKICKWLGDSPSIYLGLEESNQAPSARVHFKKESAISKDSAVALSEMIMLAQTSLLKEQNIEE
jgi:transcriptional regulator with XRE-family HTH domain